MCTEETCSRWGADSGSGALCERPWSTTYTQVYQRLALLTRQNGLNTTYRVHIYGFR
jgi:hypothetical protein